MVSLQSQQKGDFTSKFFYCKGKNVFFGLKKETSENQRSLKERIILNTIMEFSCFYGRNAYFNEEAIVEVPSFESSYSLTLPLQPKFGKHFLAYWKDNVRAMVKLSPCDL